MKKMFSIIIIIILTTLSCGASEDQEPQIKKEITDVPPHDMVFIPGGYFTMGSDTDDESPRHKVWVDPFFMDKFEVTNHQYKEFIEATGHPKPPFFNDSDLNKSDQPVVGVSYYDAASYAKWAGKRLPTEAEWERAARGGLKGKYFPWGDKPVTSRCNYAPKGSKEADGYEYTAPVGKFPSNNYGLYDMAGNVWEWCQDFYDAEYYKTSPVKNPLGPDSGYTRVLRGGSWLSINPKYLKCSSRLELKPFVQDRYYGFRCAKTP
jgi:formylglycine-generating enzyme required for sulfatase activity